MDDIHNQEDWLNVLPGIPQFCPQASPGMLSHFILGMEHHFSLEHDCILIFKIETYLEISAKYKVRNYI